MKKIVLSILVLCLFLVSCGLESNIEDSSVDYQSIDFDQSGDTDVNCEFLNEEKSKDTAEKN